MKRSAKLLACFVSLALAAVSLTPAYAAEETDISKDENVFVILNPDGSVKEQIVSNWLNSGSALADVEDVSSLTDIENLKGCLLYTSIRFAQGPAAAAAQGQRRASYKRSRAGGAV